MQIDRYENDLMTCVHCGLCLNSCPTYLETGSEADSPRGRIALMRGLHEGRLETSDSDVVRHLDLCLGCRACETACPSGVPYGSLLETARSMINDAGVRPAVSEWSRRALLNTLSRPNRFAAALKAAEAFGPSSEPVLARAASGVMSLLAGGRRSSESGFAGLPKRQESPALPPRIPAAGRQRARIALLTGCVMRVLYSDIHADTVRVLAANGCEVLVKAEQGCCGALHLHNGCDTDARAMARALVDLYSPGDDLDAIVTNSAGCGSTLKEYAKLLANEPAYAERAAIFASKISDICEFVAQIGWVAPLRALASEPHTVAYHDACHLTHGQGVREQPRRLLSLLPGVSLVPLAESEICCGSAGIYNFTEPEMARRLQQRKLDHIMATGAQIVAASNPGCLAWIESGAKERGVALRVAHPATLLAEALE